MKKHERFLPYAHLTVTLLNTYFMYLDNNLSSSEYIDKTLVPKVINKSYDEILFSGILLKSEVGQLSEIRTLFGICFSALKLWDEDGFVVIGPYLPEKNETKEIDEVLISNGLSLNSKLEFISYLNTLPVLDREKIAVVLEALSLSVYNKQIYRNDLCEIDLSHEALTFSTVPEEDSMQKRADALEKRYEYEKRLLSRVSRGEYEVIDDLDSMPISLQRVPNKLRNEKNNLILLNTLLRKAMEPAKVHPFYIDNISSKWAVKIEKIEDIREIIPCRRDMMYDYCRLARRRQLANYSSNVRGMLNYVQFNLSGTISLEDLSKRLNVNASYLSQQFNKEVGKSLPEYVTEKRIEESQRLLREQSSLSVAQIASAIGFSDVNYFGKVFKKKIGLTPSEYKKNTSIEPIISCLTKNSL